MSCSGKMLEAPKTSTIETAMEPERGIVDMETLSTQRVADFHTGRGASIPDEGCQRRRVKRKPRSAGWKASLKQKLLEPHNGKPEPEGIKRVL